MKTITIFFGGIFSLCAGFAQGKSGVAAVHAFQKNSTTAIQSRTIDETNKEATKVKSGPVNYLFYFEIKPGYKPTPTFIWVNGRTYKAVVSRNIETPVIRKTEGIGNQWTIDTLVKKTTNKVMLVTLGEETKQSRNAAKPSKAFEAVVWFNEKKESSKIYIKEIKKLSPDILQ